ncbi:MAG: helix-hairpin-helix domain-containing protein, partial [Spirochaetota bacterium]
SIAEKLDEIYTSPDEKPIRFPEGSVHLRLIQNIRDEAHRFAVTYHRTLRDKKTTVSELDLIPSIGTKHKSSLLKHFKSPKKIKSATVTELMEAEGIGEKTALKIYSFFHEK